jgi:hypothetical protein
MQYKPRGASKGPVLLHTLSRALEYCMSVMLDLE